MLVTKVSIFDGKERTWDLPITAEQIMAYERGATIQRAFPNLTPDQREFLLTGMTPQQWDDTFKEPEE